MKPPPMPEPAWTARYPKNVVGDPDTMYTAGQLAARDAQWAAIVADAVAQSGWMRAIDEAMVVHHVGVADASDDYETAKQKLNLLLCSAQSIGEYFAVAAERERCARLCDERRLDGNMHVDYNTGCYYCAAAIRAQPDNKTNQP